MAPSCGWTATPAPTPVTWSSQITSAAAWRLLPYALLLEDGSGFLEFEDCGLILFEDA